MLEKSNVNAKMSSPERPQVQRIPYEIDFLQFAEILITCLCRQLVFRGPALKIPIYGLVVIICSALRSLHLAPLSQFFSNKKNFLNLYFVKVGWGWTLALCLPFVLMINSVGRCEREYFDVGSMLSQASRLAISTFIWKYVVTFFVRLETISGGECKLNGDVLAVSNRMQCYELRGTWHPWIELSGHVFLLTYSCLVMNEEVTGFDRWQALGKWLNQAASRRPAAGDSPGLGQSQKTYAKLSPYVRALFIAQACLTIIWEVMLVSTCLYFHNYAHKFVAYIVSVLAWFVTYRVYYPNNVIPSPGLPRSSL